MIKNKSDLIVLILVSLFAVSFSWWLMSRTFGYDPASHMIKIDAKLWSDFGASIPLIRSFSMGDNLNRFTRGVPVEYPGFPGEPIRYHFGFYMLAGILERIGVRIDYALNIPSAFGLAMLLVMIYLTARYVFGNIGVGLLSVVFFLFNGTLGFIKYFTIHPFSTDAVMSIFTNHRFPVFGPWDGQQITAFWTLNIYTNQRHLAISFALTLAIIFLAIQNKTFWNRRNTIIATFAIYILMGILLITNQAAALIAGLFLAWFFLVIPQIRLPLFLAGFASLPWFLFLRSITAPGYVIDKVPGYLIPTPITVMKFLSFWWQNLGLHSIFIIIGIVFAPKRVKILFIIPLLILFTVPNILKFSPDMINNHKFFNFFLIIGNMFSAYIIIRLISLISHMRPIWLRIIVFLIPTVLVFFMTLSGIIDFFAIYNKEPGGLRDYQENPTASWIAANTPVDAVFLNSTWFYHPANLVGRYIFSGYPYFTWSYNYNKDAREAILKSIYNAPNKFEACRILIANNISYVELGDHHDEYFTTNWTLWRYEFKPVYRNEPEGVSIYDVKKSCLMN